MRHLSPAIFVLLLMPLLVAAALAHSLKEFEDQLSSEEEYFQPIDRAGTDLRLQDADGHVVRLSDFRGKVLMWHFTYRSCPTYARCMQS